MFTEQQKKEIAASLQNYVEDFPSQAKAAATLEGCSEATVIQMLTGKWSKISETMWLNISKQLGHNKRTLQMVRTSVFDWMVTYYTLAKEEGATFAIVGAGGCGKSYAAKWFAAQNRDRNVFYIECAKHWTKKYFLEKLLKSMGANPAGLNVPEMMETIVRDMRRKHLPLVIIDEVDKLPENVLQFFISLYNELNSLCGFIWQSTDTMERIIVRGVKKRASGYQELQSRIGGKFIHLPKISADDIREICRTNGITDPSDIATLVNEVLDLGGDLRRVERNFLKTRAIEIRKHLEAA